MIWNDVMVIGLWIFAALGYVALIAMVAWAAKERGRTETGFVFLAIFLTPVFALLLLAAAGDRKWGSAQEDRGKL